VNRDHVEKRDPSSHAYALGDRLAWSDGPGREAGEGVVIGLMPPSDTDSQPRYHLGVFRDGQQSDRRIVLPEGVVYPVPRWAVHMDREERLRHHRGSSLPWNELIPGE
jgi:hypothetical protein